MKKVFLLTIILLFLTAFTSFAAAKIIDVGLFFGDTVLQSLTLASGDGLEAPEYADLGTSITAKFNAYDNTVELYAYGTTNMLYKTAPDTPIRINGRGNIAKVNDKRYRGVIALYPSYNGITVINEIDIEHYLYGVVPKEAVSSWPAEALKAQAVAARTYVYSALKNKHSDYGFDVCSTTNCQVYGGYDAETAATTRAVDDTCGIIAIYNGKAVHTLFSAGNGGWVEDPKNVWGGTYPYLKAFADEYEDTDSINGLTWTVSVSADDIAAGIAKYGGNVGTVTGMQIIETASSGRVLKLKVTGTNGSFLLEKERARTFLGLKSSLYTITPPSSPGVAATSNGNAQVSTPVYVMTADGLKMISGSPKVATSKRLQELAMAKSSVYVISGRGYGHGVGMSQWGAYCMSEQGFTYEDILKYYYQNITLGTTEDLR